MYDHDGLEYENDLFGDDTVSKALRTSMDGFDDLRDADPGVLDSFSPFTSFAVATLTGTSPGKFRETLDQVMLCAFLAGRNHVAAGHPSPLGPRDGDTQTPPYVPTAWL